MLPYLGVSRAAEGQGAPAGPMRGWSRHALASNLESRQFLSVERAQGRFGILAIDRILRLEVERLEEQAEVEAVLTGPSVVLGRAAAFRGLPTAPAPSG
ncbi:hypothetical protein C5C31_10965 [Rathayibacter rathayi]|uniref:Uncharacterized protein n=2 Tax=Rathayibacter rathayi TaxID=33887 RepID=A0ABD6W886_RATRA|nr:hypothetical protein C5C04_08930 [Rathayibacter rathayi]SOE04772.1 hypothetical protein SAMN06295924_105129 [Rathayibacter rathayi NCPPB 2980 = VKM Ac-1601]PPF23828.1 hypothetical protein C5C34_07245 [Rathayibacter rathayi]PPF43689.1 hypothetical protein C5C08_13905 [Rathayibacter rathayi]PPF79252.1 hypothetical protein C5C14_09130 [Rathayibacter rathayi]